MKTAQRMTLAIALHTALASQGLFCYDSVTLKRVLPQSMEGDSHEPK
jgi:hypothetical protein